MEQFAIMLYRVSHRFRGVWWITAIINRLTLMLCHCLISPEAVIGQDVKLAHIGLGIVIGDVTIQDGVKIGQNTTLGIKDGGFPTIGMATIIYPNCVIVGKIRVGEGSIIGANTFLDKDVPPKSIVYTERKLVIRKNTINVGEWN